MQLLAITKIVVSSYHSNDNGVVQRDNHTMAQKLSMVVNERQNAWDVQLPHVECVYSNSVGSATGLTPNKVHMYLLLRLFASHGVQTFERERTPRPSPARAHGNQGRAPQEGLCVAGCALWCVLCFSW